MGKIYAVKVYRSNIGSLLRVKLDGSVERYSRYSSRWEPSKVTANGMALEPAYFQLIAVHAVFKCST